MNYCKDDEIRFQDRLTALLIVAVLMAAIWASLGSWKKERTVNEIVEFDVESIAVEDTVPLPEIETREALLPEILPPLYEPPLPPLQGEV